MKKIGFIFLILFVFQLSFSQSEKYINGKVLCEDFPVQGLEVVNLVSKKTTITDSNGYFSILAKADDTLGFVSKIYEYKRLLLEKSLIEKGSLTISLVRKPEKLDEVVINYSKINAFSLGIIQKKIKPLTVNERKLYTAGDFKPIQLLNLLGGSMQLDPIFNAINGKIKELKKNIEVENKEINIAFFKTNYFDYLFTNLRMSKEEINSFLYYLVDKESTQEILKSNNDTKIKFFLCDTLIEYRVKMK